MTVYLQDADFTLYQGDALAVLSEMPAESVDCVVTSPPYWGLRDYGTGTWDGGNPDCDHKAPERQPRSERPDSHGFGTRSVLAAQDAGATAYRDVCGKCGARRVDQQLGLEPTPDQYIANMVAVFRQVRRVLRPHGTCWINIGDSYMANVGTQAPQTKQHVGSGFCGPNRTPQQGLKLKDLVGIPWQLAFALRTDGWYLRSEIIWAKPNPMPESVTDRPTKAHEQIFLLTKSPRYWFDQEAVREPHISDGRGGFSNKETLKSIRLQASHAPSLVNAEVNPNGRNIRSVWEIATEPYPDAHFATFPRELARRCILAGCPVEVCATCGKARERLVAREISNRVDGGQGLNGDRADGGKACNAERSYTTVGWSDCGHNDYTPGIVLDPFIGSGTVAHVARHHGRHTIGIELNPVYADLCAKRTQQQSLLA